MVNGIGLAGEDALQALGTDATGKAASRLGEGFLFCQPSVDLAEVPHPLNGRQFMRLVPCRYRSLTAINLGLGLGFA